MHSPRFQGTAQLVAVASTVWAIAPVAAQPITGAWEFTASEVSNTCGHPLGPPETELVEILQQGDLVAVDVPGGAPDTTAISGEVSGSTLSIGFEVLEEGGATLYDPALNALAIAPGAISIAGTADWEFYEPLDCTGTQTWSAAKTSSATPGDLSGTWELTVTEVSDSCGPIEPGDLVIPVTIEQQGPLLRIAPPVPLGETRLAGRVSGASLSLSVALREDGGLSLFDAADNDLAIAPASTRSPG